MTSKAFDTFRRFWRLLSPHLPLDDKLPPRIALAISYFNSSYDRPLPESFLNLHIGLEVLTDVSSEMTYRLPMRIAALLATNRAEAEQLFNETKALWATRCKIAHGDTEIRAPKFTRKLKEQQPKLRQLLRRMAKAHLALFDNEKRDVKAYEKTIEQFDQQKIIARLAK